MNRIDVKLDKLKQTGEKALVTFITAGDPDIETTEQVILKMIEAGVDMIEIGVPFSDPVAEGPVIQAASQRALEGDINLNKIFDCVQRIRKHSDTPIILMMYMNSLFKYGKDAFFKMCQEKGVDGVIVPDLPFEEKEEVETEANQYDVYMIRLIAPTSNERIEKIATDSKGFIYCVSSLGVTGQRDHFATDFESFIGQIRSHTDRPLMLGFGISNAKQVRELKSYIDGGIIGSAIVKIIEEYGKESVDKVYEFTKELKAALLDG